MGAETEVLTELFAATNLFFKIFLWKPQNYTEALLGHRPLPERGERRKEGMMEEKAER